VCAAESIMDVLAVGTRMNRLSVFAEEQSFQIKCFTITMFLNEFYICIISPVGQGF